jgi:hypothetical protein
LLYPVYYFLPTLDLSGNMFLCMDFLYLIRSGLGLPDYWHPPLSIQIDFRSGKIERYPISMAAKALYPGKLNEEKVPLTFLVGTPYVSPTTVALYGLGNHEAFLEDRNDLYYTQMRSALTWLKKHRVPLGSGIGWANELDLSVYGLKAPWFSSIAQGFALSLFVRAHQLDPNEDWAFLARETCFGYGTLVEEGGFTRRIKEGLIYEEYPGPKLDAVFNGMCHALIGLWEAWKTGIVPTAEIAFTDGIHGLRALLPRFNHGRWSLYSLNQCLGKPLLASPYYQRANGLLATVVGLMIDDPEIHSYGNRWLAASNSVSLRTLMSLRIGIDRFLHAPALLNSDKSQSRPATIR